MIHFWLWSMFFIFKVFSPMISQSVPYHQKFSCKSDFMFLVILLWYFWYLVQMCLILHCKFVYAAARVSPYFFNLGLLLFHFQCLCSRFQLHVTTSKHFVFLLMLWGTIFFGFLFAIYNLQSYFWCLQIFLIFQGKTCVLQNKFPECFFVGECGICTVSISKERFWIIFWTLHKENLSFLNNIIILFLILIFVGEQMSYGM